MRAAVPETAGQPVVMRDDVEIEDPGLGQVRVKVCHCGLCHSDLSIADGTFPSAVPIVLGHEAACVIGCAVQTGVGAVLNTADVEEGATVLVLGLGGIGLSVVQGARVAGAARVIVVKFQIQPDILSCS